LLIEINTLDQSPIYEQLRDQIVLGIAGKKLAPGETLPSVRRLAADLGINFHTVNKAYAMLYDEGYIVMDRRKGAMVSEAVKKDDTFISRHTNKLAITAAEAICHNTSLNEFITLCRECYRKARGNPKEGANNG